MIEGWKYVWRVAWSSRQLTIRDPSLNGGRPMTVIEAFRYAIMIAKQLGEFR